MSDADYVCALCRRPQRKEQSDEAALAEYAEHFPGDAAAGEEVVVVCDACWRWMYDPAARRIRTENYGRRPPWTISART